MNLEKNDTIYCNKFNYLNLDELLGEILRKLINFNKYNGYCPKYLLLNNQDFVKIKNEKPNIISTYNNENYILCMRVICYEKKYSQ